MASKRGRRRPSAARAAGRRKAAARKRAGPARARVRRGRRGPLLKRLRERVERAGAVALCICFVVAVAWLVVASDAPPRDPEDLCAVFREKPRWHAAARASADRWGVSEAAQLAIVFQESSFRADARPPRRVWLGVLPGFRVSSAYGFGQVLDSTWQDYLAAGARPGARRDRIDDVLDFVGWYGARSRRVAGIAPDAVGDLYLAYHEGPTGFVRGDHEGKAWLEATARRVEARARRYEAQYAGCRAELEQRGWLPFL